MVFRFKPFRKLVNGATPSLKFLTKTFLGVDIQSGEHCSIQDAQACMRLYTLVRQKWEADLSTLRKERKGKLIKGKEEKMKKLQSSKSQTVDELSESN